MSDDDGEDSASRSNTQSDTPDKTCVYCGAVIDTNDWYPVTKRRDSDGSLQFYAFCSEDCQAAWLDEREK